MIFTLSFVALSVLGLKYKEVLLLFNCWPVESSYTLSSRWISLASLSVALPKNQAVVGEEKVGNPGAPSRGSHTFYGFSLGGLMQKGR